MYILFDIGGTNMRLAWSNGQQISTPLIKPTPKNFEQGIRQFGQLAIKLSNNQPVTAACGGIREVLDTEKTMLINTGLSSQIPDWVRKPLKYRLEQELNAPVLIENDAALAGLGEAVFGAGKDYRIVAYLTISSGVGGIKIVDKKIDPNTYGFEPGHMIVEAGLELEDFISGTALEKKYHQKPEDIKDPLIWDQVAKYLSFGLNNIIVDWSPEVVIIGGSVAKSIPLTRTKQELKTKLKIFPFLPDIVCAGLGDESGLYGALEYIKQHIKN